MEEKEDPLIPKAIELLQDRGTIPKTLLMRALMIGFNRSEILLKKLGELGYIEYREGYQSHFVTNKISDENKDNTVQI